jgi:hypothetical protein
MGDLIPRAQKVTIRADSNVFGMHPFYIPMGPTVSTARPFCLFESMHAPLFPEIGTDACTRALHIHIPMGPTA